MSTTAKKKTYAERYAEKRKQARDVGDARRSRNTSKHTLEEVRKVVQDAAIQVGQLGRRMDRDDLRALGDAIGIVRSLLTKAPNDLVALIRAFAKMESGTLRYDFGQPRPPPAAWGTEPTMLVQVTAGGLFELHGALLARVRAGKTPSLQEAALATPPLAPKGPRPGWVQTLLDNALAGDGKDGDPCAG